MTSMTTESILERLTGAIADGATITLTGPVHFPGSGVTCAVGAELTGDAYGLAERVVFRGAGTAEEALAIVLRQWEAVR